ncbi:MAG TPA: TraR/DksA family transcriptional regulator [Burkholderiales bacterium]|nr:TraR/DksA family transcriptional regulator [Burkholderiales bacterium]
MSDSYAQACEGNPVVYLAQGDIDNFRQSLHERREALRGYMRTALVEAMRNQPAAFGEAHDAGEESFAELTFGVNLAVRAREIKEVRDIDATLKRIADGSFGYCTDCGIEIGLGRLRTFPTAKRCLSCQQRHEQKHSADKDTSPNL